MLRTEDEAKQCWCPFARVVDQSGHGGNRYRMDVDKAEATCFTVCIASACMAWRWGTKVTTWKHLGGSLYVPEDRERGGYCGLASKDS